MCYAQRIRHRESKGGSEITDIVLYKRQKREKEDFDRGEFQELDMVPRLCRDPATGSGKQLHLIMTQVDAGRQQISSKWLSITLIATPEILALRLWSPAL